VKAEIAAYVLDSFALLAYFQSEPGSPRIKAVLTQAEKQQAQVYLSIINYGETVYIIEREKGLTAAQQLIAAIDQMPINVVEADRKLTFAAAHIKARHPVSYADAFAVALAQTLNAIVLTGDPEFHTVEQLVTVEWLPQA
jgi:ribonuclease VapC